MPKSTKQDIVHQLAELLKEKRLDDITVKDLALRCGVSRQAFYYHFSDIYAAVEWGMQHELNQMAAELTERMPKQSDAQRRESLLEEIKNRILDNRAVVLNTYRSFERNYVNHRLMNSVRPILVEEIKRLAAGYQVTQGQVEFISELFTMSVVNVFLNWLDLGIPNRSMEHLDDFTVAINGSAEDMIRRLEQRNKEEQG